MLYYGNDAPEAVEAFLVGVEEGAYENLPLEELIGKGVLCEIEAIAEK